MKHPDGRSTVIPVHPGEELGRGNTDVDNERCGVEQERVFGALRALMIKYRCGLLTGRCSRQCQDVRRHARLQLGPPF